MIEWVRVEVANRPVRSGRSGWFMLRFSDVSPRKPASMKIIVALVLDSFSLYISNMAIQIRSTPIMR